MSRPAGQDPDDRCSCMEPPFQHAEFVSHHVGVDETNGRFADVSIETCKRCGRTWLRYLVEYEAVLRSGRWYRGLVTAGVAARVTPHTAAAVLRDLEWRFRGGSYFGSTSREQGGPLSLEP